MWEGQKVDVKSQMRVEGLNTTTTNNKKINSKEKKTFRFFHKEMNLNLSEDIWTLPA